MPTMTATFNRVYEAMLSDNTRRRVERGILAIAIVSFVVHLLLILGAEFGLFGLNPASALLRSPIAAVYTPFSFILIYEVYLLIYFLPKSISTYIAKQYDIITLILIRRLFKDFANLSLSTDWFKIKYDLNFTYDLLASLLLFFLIYQFHRRIEPSELRSVRQERKRRSISASSVGLPACWYPFFSCWPPIPFSHGCGVSRRGLASRIFPSKTSTTYSSSISSAC